MDKYITLAEEQKEVINTLITGVNVFMTGCGGTGKSYVIQSVLEVMPDRLKARGLKGDIHVTALTGCAALLLGPDAKTLHSWAGIGLGKETASELVGKIVKNGRAKKFWRETDLLIIDEISMLTAELLEKLDDIGQRMRRSSKPFGGIQLLLVGDFCQLPPVVKEGVMNFAFQSERWTAIVPKMIELKTIHRQKDPVFHKILDEARRGIISAESETLLKSRMGLDWKSLKIRPTLLFPKNHEVDMINEANLKKLKGEHRIFKASTGYANAMVAAKVNQKDPGFLRNQEMMDREGGYRVELELAVGAQVMLIHNLKVDEGLVNGSRGVVVEFLSKETGETYVVVEFLDGRKIPIAKHKWELDGFKGVFRAQYPLRLAWACTVHKAQGATLDSALIDIGMDTFECGQAYVALSRVKSLDSLYVHDFCVEAFRLHPTVKAFYGL